VQARLDLTSLSRVSDYDTSECIGTDGWHLSLSLCGHRLNPPTGKEARVVGESRKPLDIFGEGNFTCVSSRTSI